MSINKFGGASISTLSKIMGVTGPSKFMGLTVEPPPPPSLDSFSGLIAWYKTPISGASNGVSLNPWYDSKNSYHLSGADYGPTYSTSGTLNGYSTAQIIYNNYNYLRLGGPSSLNYPATMVAVIRHTGTHGSGYGDFILGSGGTGNGITFGLSHPDAYLRSDVFNQANIGTGNIAVTADAWHVVMAVITSSTWAFWIDGVPAGNGTHSRTTNGAPIFTLGQYANGSIIDGNIAEIGIYNQDRSADAAAIYTALKDKYALQYLIKEDFETGALGWAYNGSMALSTSSPLDGTKSLRLVNTNALAITKFDPSDDVWVYMHSYMPTMDYMGLFQLRNSGGYSASYMLANGAYTVGSLCAGASPWGGSTTRYQSSGHDDFISDSAFTKESDTHIWLHYVKGTGSNSTVAWYISNTSTRPSSPTYIVTNGTGTVPADTIEIGQYSGYQPLLRWDKIRVSRSEIGSNPS